MRKVYEYIKGKGGVVEGSTKSKFLLEYRKE